MIVVSNIGLSEEDRRCRTSRRRRRQTLRLRAEQTGASRALRVREGLGCRHDAPEVNVSATKTVADVGIGYEPLPEHAVLPTGEPSWFSPTVGAVI